MTTPRKRPKTKLLPEPVMRRMLDTAIEFQRLSPWELMEDTVLVGCRDERTRELRLCSVLGAANEVFGMVSYRGPEGLGLMHALMTQDHEPTHEQFLDGMNCLKLDFSTKRELTRPDMDRLKSVAFRPQGQGHVWPVFQTLLPSWAPWPVGEEEAIQLTEDLLKVCRFARWYEQEQSMDICESHSVAEVPVVGLGDHPLTDDEIDWTPLLPPLVSAEDPWILTDAEVAEWSSLPVREGGVSEVEVAFVPAASIADASGRPRVPRAVIMSDRASYFVEAMELLPGDEPLLEGVQKVLRTAMTEHQMRPERILVRDERIFKILEKACPQIGVELEKVAQLVAAPDALQALAQHLQG